VIQNTISIYCHIKPILCFIYKFKVLFSFSQIYSLERTLLDINNTGESVWILTTHVITKDACD